MNKQVSGMKRASLMEILDRVRDLAVWVVGDVMLDEYVSGTAEKISPEAPVPVVRVRNVEYRLGGAANVARQVAALGASTCLAGIIGRDFAGRQLLELCEASGVDVRAVRQVGDRQTTRKLRALAHNQQLVRLDWEDASACPPAEVQWMIERLKVGRAPDVVILSDYAKGLLVPELIHGIARSIPQAACIVVDPKRRDFTAYRGARVITPNLSELEVAAGMKLDPDDTEAIAVCARSLALEAEVEALVVTRGANGMLVVPAHEHHVSVPVHARAIFDTTGAGDTAVAVLATALAAGASLVEAAQIANAAASITVGKVGTVSVTPGEIGEVLNGESSRKIVDSDTLASRVAEWRAAGKRIVFTNGCFDLLHAGHLSLLHRAAQCGDVLILAINSDESIQRLKGPGRPLVPEHERAAMLAALSCVDAVTIFAQDTPLEVLQSIRPDVLVKGQDYNISQVVGRELVESAGGHVELVPLLPERSTTALIERITSRHSRS